MKAMYKKMPHDWRHIFIYEFPELSELLGEIRDELKDTFKPRHHKPHHNNGQHHMPHLPTPHLPQIDLGFMNPFHHPKPHHAHHGKPMPPQHHNDPMSFLFPPRLHQEFDHQVNQFKHFHLF
jgi:hypothetical protein